MVGVDVVEIARIEKALKSVGFLEKTFTENERAYADKKSSPAETYAGIYAAKEALAKALKTELLRALREIEIGHDEDGSPYAIFSGMTAQRANDYEIEISIAHDGGVAFAVAAGAKKC